MFLEMAKLNGVAGFILANGALSGGGDEYKIRKKLIEDNLVEAILVSPQNMFYTTMQGANKNEKIVYLFQYISNFFRNNIFL